MSDRGDNELVQATLTGDSAAFDELIGRYEAKIFNMALRVTGNVEDAMDATQSAFLKAYGHLARFDPAHRFFSWIYRIGLNESLDILKLRKRTASLPVEVAEETAGPERECLGREAGRAIQAALLELTPEQRVPVVLRHLHGLSYREMSEVIGIPEKTVKSRLFAGRSQLREKLTKKGLIR